jgi:hypothetical protein
MSVDVRGKPDARVISSSLSRSTAQNADRKKKKGKEKTHRRRTVQYINPSAGYFSLGLEKKKKEKNI